MYVSSLREKSAFFIQIKLINRCINSCYAKQDLYRYMNIIYDTFVHIALHNKKIQY